MNNCEDKDNDDDKDVDNDYGNDIDDNFNHNDDNCYMIKVQRLRVRDKKNKFTKIEKKKDKLES